MASSTWSFMAGVCSWGSVTARIGFPMSQTCCTNKMTAQRPWLGTYKISSHLHKNVCYRSDSLGLIDHAVT